MDIDNTYNNYLLFNINNILSYKDIIINFIILLFFTYSFDMTLIKIFGNRARWFQLHCLLNCIVLLNITPSLIKIICDPKTGYKLLENHNESYYIFTLHLYHIIAFKNLTIYDYFHHILFVFLGVVPVFMYVNYNQIYLGYLPCSGLPGIIEYGTLVLYKNDKITLLKQKQILANVYIYIRLPLCIFGITMNYMAVLNGYIKDNIYLTFYINLLLYLNGTLFTDLTLESYYKIKYTPLKPRVFP
tara:strand:+ start:2045 stop:2776 length:732 start_codon:yes stop_codon:yes gene_type:complete